MTPRHMAPSCSSWGRSVGGGGKTVAAIVTVVVLFVALMAAMACTPPMDDRPDSNTVNPCAEIDTPPEGCEP